MGGKSESLLSPRDRSMSIPQLRHSHMRMFLLSFFNITIQTQTAGVTLIMMPDQVEGFLKKTGGSIAYNKSTVLGFIIAMGAMMTAIFSPIFGGMSDRYVSQKYGRRTLWILGGTIGNAFFLGLMALFSTDKYSNLYAFAACWTLSQLFYACMQTPFAALVPDCIPPAQYGAASGWMGLANVIGSALGGGVLGGIADYIGGYTGAYLFLAGLNTIGAVVTVAAAIEPTIDPPEPFRIKVLVRQLIDPFKSKNFRWVFITRFFMTMAIFSVEEFAQYYIGDVVESPWTIFGVITIHGQPQAASVFIGTVLVGAVLSVLWAGILSDRIGRKRLVYAAGVAILAVCIVLCVVYNYTVCIMMALVMGVGYGTYYSVEFALASDVLPSTQDHGKDMGLWNGATSIPQVIATLFAGVMLDQLNRLGEKHGLHHLGYIVIFCCSGLFVILGTVFIAKVDEGPKVITRRKDRPMDAAYTTLDTDGTLDDSIIQYQHPDDLSYASIQN